MTISVQAIEVWLYVSVVGSEYDYYDSDLERPQTGMSFQQSDYSPGISDDEFESVSQVVGPVSKDKFKQTPLIMSYYAIILLYTTNPL